MSVAAALAALMAQPIAHRGLHGPGGPLENTVASAEAAASAGYAIECDVRLTADGQMVVFHDATLDRLADRPNRVEALSADSLTTIRLRDNHTIPSLADWLDAIAGRVPVVIEIKAEPSQAPDVVAAAVGTAIAGRTGVIALESFDIGVMAACAGLAHPIGLVGDSDEHLAALARLPRCDFASWQLASVDRLASAHPALSRSAWTVRNLADHARATAAGAQSVFEGFRP